MASPWAAGRAARLEEEAVAASSTTLSASEIQQFSQALFDPKQVQLEDSVFEVLSQNLMAGDVADSGDLMLDLKDAIDGVDMSGAVINHVGNLTKGVNSTQAARIWELYDHDGNGVMDRSELRRLVHDLGNAIIRRLSNKVERISKQMSTPKDSAKELLKALDKNRDGRVQKVEFVNLAIRGLGNIDAMTADERGGSSRGPPSKRTKVQEEARALKTARRGEPGFEMIHVRRSSNAHASADPLHALADTRPDPLHALADTRLLTHCMPSPTRVLTHCMPSPTRFLLTRGLHSPLRRRRRC